MVNVSSRCEMRRDADSGTNSADTSKRMLEALSREHGSNGSAEPSNLSVNLLT